MWICVTPETCGIAVSYYPQWWACTSGSVKNREVPKLQLLCFYGINMFSPCVDVSVKGIVARCFSLPGLQLCPDFCSALTSSLWLKCKAKQPTLLYISQPVPADMCSLKHFWARDTSLVCSVLLEGKKRKRKRRGAEKNVSYFFLSLWQRVTFFDISTESLVLQHWLPDALIESPMSNRKRNKCFIELELSLEIVGRGGGWAGFLCGCLWVSVQRWRVTLDSPFKHFLGCGVNN